MNLLSRINLKERKSVHLLKFSVFPTQRCSSNCYYKSYLIVLDTIHYKIVLERKTNVREAITSSRSQKFKFFFEND